jgi:hypothetical protein
MRTLTVLLLALVSFVIAETVTFPPDATVGKDAMVTYDHPNTNYGSSNTLNVGELDYNNHASYIEFTELNDYQYDGATVNQASLHIYGIWMDGSGQYRIGPCDAPWEEDTITWNTRVGVYTAISVDYPPEADWVIYDVTAWVQNWLDGTWDNNGFSIFDNSGRDQWAAFSSSDGGTDSHYPKLVLDYSGAAVEETTWGEIKASF